MQTHIFSRSFLAKNCIFTLLKNFYPLLLPSHNCIIIYNVQFSRCIFESHARDSMKHQFVIGVSVNLFWWRVPGSNRWPPACKAGALPAELTPHRGSWKWWAKMDSNHRPHDYQSCALASWAIGPYQLHFLSRYIQSVPSKLNNVKF